MAPTGRGSIIHVGADAAEHRDLLLHHLLRRRRLAARPADDHDGDHPHARLRRGRGRRGDPDAARQTRIRAVAGGAAACVHRADGTVGGVVRAAGQQLAGRRTHARLQRRIRRRGRARPRGPDALAGGARRGHAGSRGGVRLRAAHEGVPRGAGRPRHLRAPAGAVRLLERDRIDRRDGRDRLHVAGSAPGRTRAAERAGLPGHGPVAAHADAGLLARRADRAGGGSRAVVLHRAAAPARRRRAAEWRRRCRAGGGVGFLQARAQRRQRRAACARDRRAPARRAGGRDVDRARDRWAGVRLLHRPTTGWAGFSPDTPQRRGDSVEHPGARRGRLRGGARRQPPRVYRLDLSWLPLAHQPPRGGPPEYAGSPDRDR